MAYRSWITVFIPTPLIFRYHLPLKTTISKYCRGGVCRQLKLPYVDRIFFYVKVIFFKCLIILWTLKCWLMFSWRKAIEFSQHYSWLTKFCSIFCEVFVIANIQASDFVTTLTPAALSPRYFYTLFSFQEMNNIREALTGSVLAI